MATNNELAQLQQTAQQQKAELTALQTQALTNKSEAFAPLADKQFLLGSMLLLFSL